MSRLARVGQRELVLYRTAADAPADAFLKHEHIGGEFYLVLKGKITDETGEYEKGDIVFLDARSVHTPRAFGETIVLVLWPAGVRIVDVVVGTIDIRRRRMKTLGFIGTGGMGSGMAANLIKAGYTLVFHDLRREQGKALEDKGAVFKESPQAVAESCEMVLSMLPYNEAVRAVGLGRAGLHEATTRRQVVDRFQQHRQENDRQRQHGAIKKRLDGARWFRRRRGRSGCSRNLVALVVRVKSALR